MKFFNWIKKRKPFIPLEVGSDFCLSKEEADKLKILDFEKVILMDSKERLCIFSELLGEEKADWINARFEIDVVLKNKKAGMLNWANKTEMKDKFRQEIIRKINRLGKVLNPKEEQSFMDELVDLALGIGVTEAETKNILDLSKKVEEAKSKMENGGSKEDYEKAQNDLDKYIDELKKT